MFEGGRPLAEGLAVHETAELLENVQGEDVDVVAGTLDALLDGRNLLPHPVLLVAGVEIQVEVVEEVTVFGVLETLAAQFVVQLFDGHRIHSANCLICSILYPGRKLACRNQISPILT